MGSTQRARLVRLLEADPDLGRWVDPRLTSALTRRLVVEELTLERGPWQAPEHPAAPMLGLLVIDGFLTRSVLLHRRRGVDLVGPGDLLSPWESPGSDSIAREERWAVLEPVRLAVLDKDFEADAARITGLLAELFSRAARGSRSLATHRAVAHLPNLATRLLVLLWSIADRWGHVERDGVVVGVRLSHDTLAELVGARRPSVTSAVSQLTEAGALVRARDGQLVLRGAPPPAPDAPLEGVDIIAAPASLLAREPAGEQDAASAG